MHLEIKTAKRKKKKEEEMCMNICNVSGCFTKALQDRALEIRQIFEAVFKLKNRGKCGY